MTDAVLATQGLSRRFGGLMAASGVGIELHRGRLHAVLGPNGAGKTTLINLLSGDLAASAGTIRYKGQDITRYSADRRSRIGIGRSYQKTNIFPGFTAFENCRLAAQSRAPRPLHVFADATRHRPVREAAERALDAAGLAARADRVASALSHGEQRQLEIAMVLATAPDVLLLDEPLAGMGAEEAQRMVGLLQSAGAEARDPAGRARHGCGVRGGRRHHRHGERSGAGERRAGADSREPAPCAARTSAKRTRRCQR